MRFRVRFTVFIAATAHPDFFGAEIEVGQAYQFVKQLVFGLSQFLIEYGQQKLVKYLDHPTMLSIYGSNAEFQVVGEDQWLHEAMLRPILAARIGSRPS